MKNKKVWLITSLVILLPALAGLLMWDVLPETMPTHFGMDGQTDGWSGKAFAIFAPTLFLLLGHWLCIWAAQWDRRNWGHNEKMMTIILWIFPAVSVILMGLVYATALGYAWDVSGTMMILLGLMFLAMGNYLPKCRQNATLGIKLPWTLYNEENWNRTHRFGGKCWVAAGVGFVVLGFVWPNFGIGTLTLMIAMVALPTLYSWLLYRRQVKDGTWTQSQSSKAAQEDPALRRMGKWGMVAVVCIVLLVLAVLFTGDVEVICRDEVFTVESTYWQDLTVHYDDVTAVELREEGVDGERTFGFGSPRLLAGSFQNEEFGFYTRYTYTGCDACVVVWLGDEVLVLNGPDVASTVELCARLTEKIR